MSDQLEIDLLAWDGKDTAILSQLAKGHERQPEYFKRLLDGCAGENTQIAIAASWLVLDAMKRGNILPTNDVEQWFLLLDHDNDWQVHLHVCQSVQYLHSFASVSKASLPSLQSMTSHRRPFLRAWAIDALVRVALADGAKAEEQAREVLRTAASDPAASVKARVRNLHKELSLRDDPFNV